MASHLTWHSENRVLSLKLSGNVQQDTLLKNSEVIASILNRVSTERVHVIMDMAKVTQLPRDTGSLRNVMAPMLTHEKMGWTVVITHHLLLQSILNRTVQRLTERWGYVSSFREAVELLRKADAKLWNMPVGEQTETRTLYITK